MVHRILTRGWGSPTGACRNQASRGKDRYSASGEDQAQPALGDPALGDSGIEFRGQMAAVEMEGTRKLTCAVVLPLS